MSESDLEERVKKEITGLSNLVAKTLNLEPVEFTSIKIDNVPNSRLVYETKPLTLSIIISMKEISNGFVYLEEIGHAYRFIISRKKSDLPLLGRRWQSRSDTDEFIGRIMQEVYPLIQNLYPEFDYDFKHLFTDSTDRRYRPYLDSVKQLYSRINEVYLINLNDILLEQKAKKWTEGFLLELNEAYLGYYTPDIENIKKILQKNSEYIISLMDKYEGLDISRLEKFCKELNTYFNLVRGKVELLSENSKDGDNVDFFSFQELEIRDDMFYPISSFATPEKDAFLRLNESSKIFIDNVISHFRGYIAAEMFLENHSLKRKDAEKLVRMCDTNLRRKYIYTSEVNQRVSELIIKYGLDISVLRNRVGIADSMSSLLL
jgi:hypothetical protein